MIGIIVSKWKKRSGLFRHIMIPEEFKADSELVDLPYGIQVNTKNNRIRIFGKVDNIHDHTIDINGVILQRRSGQVHERHVTYNHLSKSDIDVVLAPLNNNNTQRLQTITKKPKKETADVRTNYDCENFAESVRVHLSEKYGANNIGIIWGDTHAWNFTITSDEGLIMFEPQTDEIVTELKGIYSVERRCEVLI